MSALGFTAEQVKQVAELSSKITHEVNAGRIATLESEVAALRAEVEGMRDAVDEYALGDERYKYVRRLNVMEFAKLYQRNIKEGIPFDDLIDLARKESSK